VIFDAGGTRRRATNDAPQGRPDAARHSLDSDTSDQSGRDSPALTQQKLRNILSSIEQTAFGGTLIGLKLQVMGPHGDQISLVLEAGAQFRQLTRASCV
jgi:hypothetical protein